ncbi:MAG TPA: hypothetical protein VEB21_14475 [Terriglobales bacterium]|nr:hypothetical protein [Terriglobales bacterium]
MPLGERDGVTQACRPDFVFLPLSGDPSIQPVAVFCDSVAFHVQPGEPSARLADDIRKRRGILDSGRWCVWSVTWKDLDDFEAGKGPSHDTLWENVAAAQLGKAAELMQLALPRSTAAKGSFDLLLMYLADPRSEPWKKLASTCSLGWLSSPPFLQPEVAIALENELLTHSLVEPRPLATQPKPGAVLGRALWRDHYVALAIVELKQIGLKNPDAVRWTLRLMDEAARRADAAFEESWRTFLHAWNVMQFHPQVEVVSSEMLDATAPAAAPAWQVSAEAAEGQLQDSGLGEVYLTAEAKELITGLGPLDVPAPVVAYELDAQDGRCGAEADLAWPEARVAVLAARQVEDAEIFLRAGWKVLQHPTTAEAVLEALCNG